MSAAVDLDEAMTDERGTGVRKDSRFNWQRGIGAVLLVMAVISVLTGAVTLATLLFAGVGIWLLVLGSKRR